MPVEIHLHLMNYRLSYYLCLIFLPSASLLPLVLLVNAKSGIRHAAKPYYSKNLKFIWNKCEELLPIKLYPTYYLESSELIMSFTSFRI